MIVHTYLGISWLKDNHPEEHNKAISATGPKQNILNKVFKHCGIKGSTYDHGFKRGVYLAMMYDNGCEFLRGEIKKRPKNKKEIPRRYTIYR